MFEKVLLKPCLLWAQTFLEKSVGRDAKIWKPTPSILGHPAWPGSILKNLLTGNRVVATIKSDEMALVGSEYEPDF